MVRAGSPEVVLRAWTSESDIKSVRDLGVVTWVYDPDRGF